MKKIGFLGMGIMGSAMAANLLRAGHEVTVWNRSPEKCAPLLSLGARQGETPAQVAAASEVTFAMLADPAAAAEVFSGEDGVVEGLSAGKIYVDISTVDPATAMRISSGVRTKGGRFLEAPVSGSKKPAEEGTLVFLCGGERPIFEEVKPLLQVMGKSIFYLGAEGQGARMKLVVNMIMGCMMTALCEGLALGEKSGLAPADMLDVLEQGALANPLFRIKGPAIVEGNFPPAFPLRHMQKDLRLALALGDENSQPLFSAAAANGAFVRARAQGFADEDFSAVFKAVAGSCGR